MGQQAGRTTEQMLEAPRGAIYVWVNAHFGYPKDLASKLGREDLKIVSPGWITIHNLSGTRQYIVVDHAALLTATQVGLIQQAERRQERVAVR